MRGRE
jgi:hypothetical protein